MVTYTVKVPGEPRAWTVWPKRGRMPLGTQRQKVYQAVIRLAIAEQLGMVPVIEGPVKLEIWFYRGFPLNEKVYPPANREKRIAWIMKYLTHRPDLANYMKAAEDALQGVLISNDSQVVEVIGYKRYTEEPEGYTLIKVTELSSEYFTDISRGGF